jgi:hypothetical protein
MQHAKRMVLVDERFLENIWRKENSSWRRPTDYKAKASLHHELRSDLDDTTLPDDIKAKAHQQHLNRFLHTSRQLPVPQQQQDLISLEADDLLKLDVPEVKELYVKPKKPKKEKKVVEPAATPRRSKRGRRKSRKIDWEAWNK